MNRKIAVLFFGDRDINTYPYIYNVLQILSQQGFKIDVFINERQQTSMAFVVFH